MSNERKQLTRRQFLRGVAGLVGGLGVEKLGSSFGAKTHRVYLPVVGEGSKTNDPRVPFLPLPPEEEKKPSLPIQSPEVPPLWMWQKEGPPVQIQPGEDPDGIRASAVSPDGSVFAGTWLHGLWYRNDREWGLLSGQGESVSRHILPMDESMTQYVDGNRAVVVTDNGLLVVRQAGQRRELEVGKISFPTGFSLSFAQTGFLLEDGGLLLGGMGGMVKVSPSLTQGRFEWEEMLLVKQDNVSMLVRTIVVDLQDSNNVFCAGWWGYSGWQFDGRGKIENGAGVWRSREGGQSGTWEQILPNINVNCLWIHPGNSQIIVAGTEGAGDHSTREPKADYPSLLISLDGGEGWQSWNPKPWVYDLITPQQGLVYHEGYLYVSCWGGPVYRVRLPEDVSERGLKSLEWEFLGETVVSRKGFVGGHLSIIGLDDRILTGSRRYGEENVFPFTPLVSLKLIERGGN